MSDLAYILSETGYKNKDEYFNECFKQFLIASKEWTDENKKEFCTKPAIYFHMSIGMWIRNIFIYDKVSDVKKLFMSDNLGGEILEYIQQKAKEEWNINE